MSKGLPRSLAHRPFGEINEPYVRKVRYDLSGKVVSIVAAGAGVGFGTFPAGGLPQGNILLLGFVSYIGFSTTSTNAIAAFNGDYALGTDPDANGTLAANEVNIQASTPLGPATARVVTPIRTMSATPLALDNTDGLMELNLNVLLDATDITDATSVPLTLTGYVEMAYAVLGDD